jgi:hypothetical protein
VLADEFRVRKKTVVKLVVQMRHCLWTGCFLVGEDAFAFQASILVDQCGWAMYAYFFPPIYCEMMLFTAK